MLVIVTATPAQEPATSVASRAISGIEVEAEPVRVGRERRADQVHGDQIANQPKHGPAADDAGREVVPHQERLGQDRRADDHQGRDDDRRVDQRVHRRERRDDEEPGDAHEPQDAAVAEDLAHLAVRRARVGSGPRGVYGCHQRGPYAALGFESAMGRLGHQLEGTDPLQATPVLPGRGVRYRPGSQGRHSPAHDPHHPVPRAHVRAE